MKIFILINFMHELQSFLSSKFIKCVCDAGLIKYKSFTQITRTLDLIYFLYDFGRKFIAILLKVVIQVYLRVFLFIFL